MNFLRDVVATLKANPGEAAQTAIVCIVVAVYVYCFLKMGN